MDTDIIFNIKDGELEELDVQNIADLKIEVEDAIETVNNLINQCDEIIGE